MATVQTTRKIQSILFFTLLLCLTMTISQANASTTALTFTAPSSSGVVLPELDEFATTVMGDPWDMNQPTDLWAYRFESAMTNSVFANGIYSAKMTDGNGAERITLLTAGATNNAAMRIGKTGYAFPIDADHYRYLTYRIYKSNSQCNSSILIWHENDTRTSAVKGISNVYPACETSTPGWHTIVVDLQTLGIQSGSKNWSGTIRDLFFKPFAGAGAANATVKLDWARLTSENPRTARPYTIQWTGSSSSVDLYASLDDKVLSSNDFLIAGNVDGSSGSHTFQTGVLPSGTYYIGADTGGGIIWSSGAVVINTSPQIKITSPSKTSGQEFSETVLGNAWDMNHTNDLNDSLPFNWQTCVSNPSFVSSIYAATLTGCSTDTYYTDARFILGHMNPPGDNPSIDTDKYRYFSFRYMLSGEQNIYEGWVARMGWWRENGSGGTTESTVMSRDMMLLEGWNTYSADLWAADAVDEAHPVQVAWRDSSPNRLRFDPAELFLTRLPANVQIDWIKLTAMDEIAQGNSFAITYDLFATQPTATTFYYDTDTNPSNGASLIGTVPALATYNGFEDGLYDDDSTESGLSVVDTGADYSIYLPIIMNDYCADCVYWDTTAVSLGEYYICAELDDSYNITYRCSEAPVKVVP